MRVFPSPLTRADEKQALEELGIYTEPKDSGFGFQLIVTGCDNAPLDEVEEYFMHLSIAEQAQKQGDASLNHLSVIDRGTPTSGTSHKYARELLLKGFEVDLEDF
jgi:hypothetical protein